MTNERWTRHLVLVRADTAGARTDWMMMRGVVNAGGGLGRARALLSRARTCDPHPPHLDDALHTHTPTPHTFSPPAAPSGIPPFLRQAQGAHAGVPCLALPCLWPFFVASCCMQGSRATGGTGDAQYKVELSWCVEGRQVGTRGRMALLAARRASQGTAPSSPASGSSVVRDQCVATVPTYLPTY